MPPGLHTRGEKAFSASFGVCLFRPFVLCGGFSRQVSYTRKSFIVSFMKNDRNQDSPGRNAGGGEVERKAFMFYTNWFEDTADALSREEQGDFFRAIVRYASRGELPGDDVSPVVKSMFGLVRNVIDANSEKYDKIVEKNRQRAAKSAEKRSAQSRKAKVEKTVENEQFSGSEQILDTRYLKQETKNMLFEDEKERKNESQQRVLGRSHDVGSDVSAGTVQAGGVGDEIDHAAPAVDADQSEVVKPSREEAEAYWRERGFKSDWKEFYAYYERLEWRNIRGGRLRSWKSAAFFWEDKYRKDVLPAIRRTAAVEAQEAKVRRDRDRAVENARFRAEAREARAAEADERAAKAVSPEQGKFMFDRAMQLCANDSDRAIDLLKRSDSDPALFARLTEGYKAA